MKFKIQVKKCGPNLYLASCLNLPGCHVQGRSEQEVKQLIQIAIAAYLKSYKQHHEKPDIRR